MGKCKVELGVTVNLGNFESMKVAVSYEEEAGPEMEKAVFDGLEKKVQARLDEIVLTQGEHIMRFLPAAKEELGIHSRR